MTPIDATKLERTQALGTLYVNGQPVSDHSTDYEQHALAALDQPDQPAVEFRPGPIRYEAPYVAFPGEAPTDPEEPEDPPQEEPEDPPADPMLHPHEPAGLPVIARADGSVAHANGERPFGWPGFTRYSDPHHLTVVDDPDNPTGSGKAVRVQWIGGEDSGAANFSLGGVREIYIAYRVVMPTSWPGFGHKWYYLMAGDKNPGDYAWNAHEPNDSWRLIDGAGREVIDAEGVLSLRDEEMLMERHYRIVDGTRGTASYWLNGKLVGHGENVEFDGAAFTTLRWYNKANGDQTGFFNVRELYVSGR